MIFVRSLTCTAILLMAGCGGTEKLQGFTLHGSTMGTSYSVTLIAPPTELGQQALTNSIDAQLDRIENLASTYRVDSELSVFNSNPSTDWIPVSEELCAVISKASALGQLTGGAFDVTIGPLVNLWGFGPVENGRAEANRPPTPSQIAAAMRHVGPVHTDCAQPALRKTSAQMFVDLSGWAKGYAVDQLATLLDQAHVDNYLVEIGGELRVRGLNAASRPFAIGVEEPLPGKTEVRTSVRITDTGMATSGDYRNFVEFDGRRFSHTIDPRTGWPVDHSLASVTVVCSSTADADAIATALLVLGLDKGMALANRYEIAAYFVSRTENGFTYASTSTFATLIEK